MTAPKTAEQIMGRAHVYAEMARELRAQASQLPWWRVWARAKLRERADSAASVGLALRMHALRMLDHGR